MSSTTRSAATLAEPAFRSIAWRGRYLVVGFAGGPIPALPWNLPLLKGASVVGVFWGEFVRREPKAFRQAMAELFGWYAQGRVKPAIDSRLADDAHCPMPMPAWPRARCAASCCWSTAIERCAAEPPSSAASVMR